MPLIYFITELDSDHFVESVCLFHGPESDFVESILQAKAAGIKLKVPAFNRWLSGDPLRITRNQTRRIRDALSDYTLLEGLGTKKKRAAWEAFQYNLQWCEYILINVDLPRT